MKRRRLVEAENARLRDENARMARRIAEFEERAVVLTADAQALQLRAALAESKDRIPGMCPDRATCVATCSAADAWHNQQREANACPTCGGSGHKPKPDGWDQYAHLESGTCECHDSWDQCECEHQRPDCGCCPGGTGLCGPLPCPDCGGTGQRNQQREAS